jgi:hypothetical protein
MTNRAILKRLEALEQRKRDDYKPADLSGWFAGLAVLFVAKLRKGESLLASYARGCRYHGGVAELRRIAADDPEKFYKKHAKVTTRPSPHACRGVRLPPVMPTRERVESVRQFVLSYTEPAETVALSSAAEALLQDCEKVRARLKAATS